MTATEWESKAGIWFSPITETGCWIWMRFLKPNGYGQIYRNEYAHRIAWEASNGPIPDGLEIDHVCRTPSCVNPSHLRAVTHRENLLSGRTLTAKEAAQTHCLRGHPLFGENLRLRRSGKRECKACQRSYRLKKEAS